jgi:RNA-directed DNA polymerase
MQSKLATWSSKDKGRRFDRLLRVIADRSWLQEAARVALASRGAGTPGIDGMDKHAMESELPFQLESIRSELLAGTYQPQPAKRVYWTCLVLSATHFSLGRSDDHADYPS